MKDEMDFRSTAKAATDNLKRSLMEREEDETAGFEVEDKAGVLSVLFDNPAGRFDITLNVPVHQIWVSAPAAGFKLDWDSKLEEFVFPRTGETLRVLVERLISEYHAPNPGHL
jgi:iron donor protein CyaY